MSAIDRWIDSCFPDNTHTVVQLTVSFQVALAAATIPKTGRRDWKVFILKVKKVNDCMLL